VRWHGRLSDRKDVWLTKPGACDPEDSLSGIKPRLSEGDAEFYGLSTEVQK